MSTQPQSTTTLAELATVLPAASRVFHRHGLDFCCNGARPLASACAERGLDPQAVLAEVAAEGQGVTKERWDQRPLAEIVDFIVGYYHRRLRAELPELLAMAERVEQRHADKPSRPQGLAAHLAHVHMAVLDHLEKEEQILFPMIRALEAGRTPAMHCGVEGPIEVMEMEHDLVGAAFAELRTLADDYRVPAHACTTWRALWGALDAFERDLHRHVHLENNVLHPKARALAGR